MCESRRRGGGFIESGPCFLGAAEKAAGIPVGMEQRFDALAPGGIGTGVSRRSDFSEAMTITVVRESDWLHSMRV